MARIGLIPAAGAASRISPLPCSKEIYPMGFRCEPGQGIKPKAACHALLESMAIAHAERVYMVLRSGKWDIPAYLGNGALYGLNLAYLVTDPTPGVAFTVDCAFPFVQNHVVLFGFPDIVFTPNDAFVRLLDRQQASGAGVVLGLYRAQRSHKMDMVEIDSAGRVREILIKPPATTLEHAWIIAVWTGVFTRFMHAYLSEASAPDRSENKELHIGAVIRAYMGEGFVVETVIFDNGQYVDIGTPEDLIAAVKAGVQGLDPQ
ncbi:NDP-sugar synthase [Desulfococcus sp.]|uniref:nucleotidyltransferase family protein n=1 Tax=Desulfococcus sp. TaxID=2025834 RepID=UPI0035944199